MGELKAGYQFVKGTIISKFFYGSIAANFSFGLTLAVLPAYANDRGGAEVYGYFMAAFSVGVLIGALLSPTVKRYPFGKMVIGGFGISAILWLSSAFIPINQVAILLFALALIPLGITEVSMASVGQQIIPKHYIARVFSLISSVSTSAMPLGALIGGILGTYLNSSLTFAIGSAGMVVMAVVWFVIPQLRNIPRIDQIDSKDYIDSRYA